MSASESELDRVVPEEWSVTDDDEGLAALVNLVVVLADSKFFLGRRFSDWLSGGPSLESAVALAAIAQEELGHARALYPLLEELPLVDTPGPLQRGAERERKYCMSCLSKPWEWWADVVAALILVDPALTMLFRALENSRYVDLRQRAARVPSEEVFHRKYADGRVRDLARTAQGRQTLQRRIDWMLPEVLMWFGPSREPGVAALKSQGLIEFDNDEMRDAFQTDVFPILEENGLCVEVGELPWERWNSLQRRLG
ncbi:MAG: phenylacetate-CoA oxygenase subunit PaaI [Solirubrobacterales bacterium]|nr:phenylacetate-CoA oxygenase subunit PaaI [Solirubrobacterales bacterium]MBV9717374.1 phenylacetate-CoA oxygenase subunit PaaI [Solirubrobacterales bacterium]